MAPRTITRRCLLLAGICSLLLAAAPKGLASAEDKVDEALTVSKNWVGQIDAGQYDESYNFGCNAMHTKVTEDKWSTLLKTVDNMYGSVVSRKQVSHIYKPNGFEGTEGEFLVITYDTAFKKLDAGKEVVVLKWEDGKWRGAGYSAGPKPAPEDEAAPQPDMPQTETTTLPHAKPPPKTP